MTSHLQAIRDTDPSLYELILDEERRQASSVRLIASENYVSNAVLQASGSVLTNKYSEGYAGRRYYEGQEVIDKIERLAISRACRLFGADHANVQPYSGSPANLAVYNAFCAPGDTILGMGLPHGGHLTHGWKVSVTGKWFNALQYSVHRDTELIDYDEVYQLAKEHRPKLLIAGATAYPRVIDFDKFAEIAREVGAVLMCDIAHIAGLVAGGAHPSPVPVADVVTTTTHKTLRGPRGGMILCKEEHKKAIDRAVFPALQGGPHNHTTAGIAVALAEASLPNFRDYAAQVVRNAHALADALTSAGLRLVTGGTDNHLLLVDFTPRGVGGKPVAQALNRAGIVCNYNSIPYDPRKPFDPSGIRIGTPAVTSRGMGEDEMRRIGGFIDRVTHHLDDEAALQKIQREVAEMCDAFPAPGLEYHSGGTA
jgi:glycine hydroxymethyltransferase